MGFWRGRGKEPPEKPAPVQLRPADRHPFSLIDGYVPLHQPEFSLYRAIREAVPVVDAAVLKLVRLAGGVGVTCQDKEAERALNHFLRTVPVGWNQKGIQAFLDSYLDCLLTCGRAVGRGHGEHPVRGCAGLCGGGGCGDQGHWRGVRHPRLPGTGADDSGAADRPDGDSSLPAGAELVLHRADEQPAGGHYDQ